MTLWENSKKNVWPKIIARLGSVRVMHTPVIFLHDPCTRHVDEEVIQFRRQHFRQISSNFAYMDALDLFFKQIMFLINFLKIFFSFAQFYVIFFKFPSTFTFYKNSSTHLIFLKIFSQTQIGTNRNTSVHVGLFSQYEDFLC